MSGITLSKQQEVTYTQKETGYIISSRDWERLKSFLSKLKVHTSVWSNAAWCSLGVGLPSLASWITNQENIVFLVLGVAGMAGAVVSFCASRSEKRHVDASMDTLNEVVKEIDDAIVNQG